MKRIKLLVLSVLLAITGCSCAAIAKPKIPAYAQATCSNYEELSITLLHPHIEKAISDYYGYNRRYEIGDSQLEILERKGNVFTVKITVDTFEGAHNNYFTEILKFTITPFSVTLDDYSHSEFNK
ncbi:MAG: DUF3888 domain-containing protein [Clostridia bacterium]|nr:DUF3888 domain-containing protein [Clostridia bacterium]